MAEYQIAALLMAVYFRGMAPEETRAVTRIMIESGETWSWPDVDRPVADKHSTGGVGDKVSLVLAPLVAACGVAIPMVSGRGLGHTGGTLDKLESIPGFDTGLSKADFDRLVPGIGYAMGGQTEAFAPLDKELYSLRDVTGTVESPPLIVASILSKKIAEGLDALVLDVKWGDGAFMREREDAESLGRALIEVATEFGVRTEALLTDMNEPLGRCVGHTLEVVESIEMLAGGPVDRRLREVVLGLADRLLVLTGVAGDDAEARRRLESALEEGAALERFSENVAAQGGDPEVIAHPARMPTAPVKREILAREDSWMSALPARAVGRALIDLGGGRRMKGDEIDRSVGFEFPGSVGDRFETGEPWAIVHARREGDAERAERVLNEIVEWSGEAVEKRAAITARLEPDQNR